MTAMLLADEAPRLLQPTLAAVFGVDGALFLQQVHYLRQNSRHEHAGQKWIYNTHAGWQRYFPFWGVGKIGHLIRALVQAGVLVVGRWDRNPLNRTNWYTLDEAHLAALVAAQRAGVEIAVPLPAAPAAPAPVPLRETARWTTRDGALQDHESARSKQRASVQRIQNKEEAVEEDSVPIPARVYPPPPPLVRTVATTGTTPVLVAAQPPANNPVPLRSTPAIATRVALLTETPALANPPAPAPTDPAIPLLEAAWQAYQRDLDTSAPPGLRACMARDIRTAFERGIALTVAGLTYAVVEATKARGPRWPYLFRIWQAHPAGPPTTPNGGDSRYVPTTSPEAARAARDAARAADSARAQVLLSQLLGGPLPPPVATPRRAARAPALCPV